MNVRIITFTFLVSSIAGAHYYDTYRADYPKGAFCAAIAGACAADNDPENSFFQNPAALEAHEKEPEGLVFDTDYNPGGNIEPGIKPGADLTETTYMGGAGNQGDTFGFGLAFYGRDSTLNASSKLYDDQNRPQSVNSVSNSRNLFFNLPMALRISPHFIVGGSISALYYHEDITIDQGIKVNSHQPDKFPVVGFSAGILTDISKTIRLGSWIRSATSYVIHEDISVTKFSQQTTYNEDIGLNSPWEWATGIAWRPWQDRRTLFLDLDVIGPTKGGFLRSLDTIGSAKDEAAYTPKGRTLALEPHLAWRAPWWSTSNGLYYLGTYYENGRWQGISGRFHGTAGVSYKFKDLPLAGDLEGVVAVDYAQNFFDLIFSFR